MPFDLVEFVTNDVKTLKSANALPRERLKSFINILRDPKQWPKGFTWDFGQPQHCAMGMFEKFHGREIRDFDLLRGDDGLQFYEYVNRLKTEMAEALGLSMGVFNTVFVCGNANRTASHVADMLEMYIEMPCALDLYQKLSSGAHLSISLLQVA